MNYELLIMNWGEGSGKWGSGEMGIMNYEL
jgi:hypothetical protein